MISIVAALDEKNGIANENGIPWDIKIDKEHFRKLTLNSRLLMGYRTYLEFKEPLANRTNYVLTHRDEDLRDGFIKIKTIDEFINLPESKDPEKNTWIIGGGGLFYQTLSMVKRLYLTRIQADYNCLVFFPDFEKEFRKISSEKRSYEGLTLYFEIWERLSA
jgi:dihydrofolate reductase